MAIIQENRAGAPQPEVTETDYGAKTVRAAVEVPVEPAVQESVVEETPAEETPVVKRPVTRRKPAAKRKK